MNAWLLIGVLRALWRFRQRESWTREQLHAHQAEGLAALREWSWNRSPFYREFHQGLEQAPLQDLPVLTKAVLMEHFDSLVTDRAIRLSDVRAHLSEGSVGRFRNRYEVAATSGSTGHPGVFLYDPEEWVNVIASFARAREWAGLRLNLLRRSRMAVVSSTNERNLSARVGRAADTPFLPTLRLDATRPIQEITAELNAWQPRALVAYASMAYFLAGEQAAGNLNIHPEAVFTSSEVLTDQMRERLVEVWGNSVFDEYASTETASLAAEDRLHHGMHLFEDLLIVENVDAQNRTVAPGTFGEKLLVTVLFSRTQPLIRYEITDSVRVAVQPAACRLPFQIIDGVRGRLEDVLVMRGDGNQPVRVHPNVFHDIMDAVPNNGWQIVEEQDILRLRLVPSRESIDVALVRRSVEAALAAQGVVVPAVQVEQVDSIPKSASGKTPLIKAWRPE